MAWRSVLNIMPLSPTTFPHSIFPDPAFILQSFSRYYFQLSVLYFPSSAAPMSLAAPPSHEVATSSMDGHLIAEPEPGHAPSPDNMDGPSSSSISPSPARDGVVTLSSEYNQANESAQNLKSSSHVHAHVPGVANPTTTAIDPPISDSHLNEAPVESKLGSKSTSFWRLWMVELVLAVCSLCSFASMSCSYPNATCSFLT